MSRLPSSFDKAEDDVSEMPFMQKLVFHCKEQPLVPLGCLLTTGAVVLAAHNVRTGNKRKAQLFFRWRVGLQALTLVALVAGSFMYSKKKLDKSAEDKLKEKAKLREQLWIQELERREYATQLRKKRAEFVRLKAQEDFKKASELEKEVRELEAKVHGEVNVPK